MHKNPLSHRMRSNARRSLPATSFAVIAWYLAIAALGFSGCSDTPIQTAASNPAVQQSAVASPPVAEPKKPPQIVHQEPIESLLVQLKDNDSCLNQLSNLRFALEHELFHREDFYTYRTASRFFGKWYELTTAPTEPQIQKTKPDTPIPYNFSATSKNRWGRSRDKAIYPKRSCFSGVRLGGDGDPKKLKPIDQVVYLRASPEYPWRKDNLPNPDNNPKFHEFVDAFQPMELVSIGRCGLAVGDYDKTRPSPSIAAHENFLAYKAYQKDMPQHAFGGCRLIYKLNTPHYRVTLELITYRDGSIHHLFIYSILKEN